MPIGFHEHCYNISRSTKVSVQKQQGLTSQVDVQAYTRPHFKQINEFIGAIFPTAIYKNSQLEADDRREEEEKEENNLIIKHKFHNHEYKFTSSSISEILFGAASSKSSELNAMLIKAGL